MYHVVVSLEAIAVDKRSSQMHKVMLGTLSPQQLASLLDAIAEHEPKIETAQRVELA